MIKVLPGASPETKEQFRAFASQGERTYIPPQPKDYTVGQIWKFNGWKIGRASGNNYEIVQETSEVLYDVNTSGRKQYFVPIKYADQRYSIEGSYVKGFIFVADEKIKGS